jgi:hypothetical protein
LLLDLFNLLCRVIWLKMIDLIGVYLLLKDQFLYLWSKTVMKIVFLTDLFTSKARSTGVRIKAAHFWKILRAVRLNFWFLQFIFILFLKIVLDFFNLYLLWITIRLNSLIFFNNFDWLTYLLLSLLFIFKFYVRSQLNIRKIQFWLIGFLFRV